MEGRRLAGRPGKARKRRKGCARQMREVRRKEGISQDFAPDRKVIKARRVISRRERPTYIRPGRSTDLKSHAGKCRG